MYLLHGILSAANTEFVDASDMSMVRGLGRPASEYGLERLWGAIGYGWIAAPISGILIQSYGFKAAFMNQFFLGE